ncbi:MAG: zinc ABC transporter substrate-binding protein [Elusimicrobia bacterium]|nr:zinc ABC transporter substrate-binding protein [Elusimicrobiota bacterium]MDE2313693.1 zinc ABC transporter substrate-binding protein [Elusimicrobiota bacterium]
MKTRRAWAALLISGLLLLAAAAASLWRARELERATAPAEAGRLQVAAGFYPLYFFASRVGGDKAQVFDVTPDGTEPHDYELTPLDVARIEEGRLLILNGAVEPWGRKVARLLNPERTRVLVAARGLMTRRGGDEDSSVDPHVWLSPRLSETIVRRIERAYADIDPAGAPCFAANARALTRRLAALDLEYRRGLAHCARKDIVTSHAAFGYLARDYGLTQVSIGGLSPDSQPSPRQLAGVADLARKRGVKVIFFERLVSPKLSDTIAREIGAKTMVLDPIEGLTFADAAAGKDYFTQMRQNLANLRSALQCR